MHRLGETLELGAGSLVGCSRALARPADGFFVLCVEVRSDRDINAAPLGAHDDRNRERCGTASPSSARDQQPKFASGDEARTLSVAMDDQCTLWKPWLDVGGESRDISYGDLPLEGPLACPGLAKHMLRFGGEPAPFLSREAHLANRSIVPRAALLESCSAPGGGHTVNSTVGRRQSWRSCRDALRATAMRTG